MVFLTNSIKHNEGEVLLNSSLYIHDSTLYSAHNLLVELLRQFLLLFPLKNHAKYRQVQVLRYAFNVVIRIVIIGLIIS